MNDSEAPRDPRAMSDEELADVPTPPAPADPDAGSDVVVEDEYAEGEATNDGGAKRDAPAGEDYAGSGF